MADWNSFEPTEYEASRNVKLFSGALRFGQPSNIALVLQEDEMDDYVRGLVYSSLFILIFFSLWNLILCIFMCLGRNRVGFLSGRCFHSFVSEEERELVKPSDRKRQSRVRMAFIACGIGYAAAGFLSVSNGLTNLEEGVDRITHAVFDTETLVQEAEFVTSVGIRNINAITIQLRNALNTSVVNPVCSLSELQDSPSGAQFAAATETTKLALEQLEDLSGTNIDDLIGTFDDYSAAASEGARDVEDIDLTGWQSMLYLSFHTFVPTLFVVSALLVHFQTPVAWLRHFLSWVIMPIFIFMNIVAWVLSAGILAGVGGTSDFCYPLDDAGPDESVRALMIAAGYSTSDLEYRIADFYVRQCSRGDVDNPMQVVIDYLPQVQEVLRALSEANPLYTDNGLLVATSFFCGQDLSPIRSIGISLALIADALIDATLRVLDITSCSIIVPVYNTGVPEGACKYSADALTWLFGTTLAMGVLGTTMITLRAAYKPVVELVMSSDLNARMGGEEQARGNSKGDAVHENNSVDDSSLYEPEPDTIHELTGYVDKLQSQVKR